MREHEVDVVLCERVKGRSLRQHPADLLVVTLDVRLLLRVVRVAEEHPRAPLELRRVVLGVDAEELNHLRVGELASVVGYQKFLITDIIRNLALSGISDAA